MEAYSEYVPATEHVVRALPALGSATIGLPNAENPSEAAIRLPRNHLIPAALGRLRTHGRKDRIAPPTCVRMLFR